MVRVKSMSGCQARPLDATAAEERGSEGLRAGEVARRAGVSKDTLRFYERRGLLEPPRRASNNYRLFPIEVVERLRWIRQALAVGFTIVDRHDARSLMAAIDRAYEDPDAAEKRWRTAMRGKHRRLVQGEWWLGKVE
jgi:DNA-binding transcriptional MerR regulator